MSVGKKHPVLIFCQATNSSIAHTLYIGSCCAFIDKHVQLHTVVILCVFELKIFSHKHALGRHSPLM